MTDAAAAAPSAAPPSPAPNQVPANADPAQWVQTRTESGDPQYVRRDSLSAEKPKSTAPSTRPSWCPESAWHPETGFDHAAFSKHYDEHVRPAMAWDAAEQIRRSTLPQSADSYEAKTSPAFKVPEGAEFRIDARDPMWTAARHWAHENGLTQAQFEKGIDLIAGREAFGHQQVRTALNREVAKLGPAGATRVQAIENFYADMLGKDAATVMVSRIFNANDVHMHEMTMRRFTSQRGGSPPQTKRGLSDEAYAAMTPDERYNYAKSHSNAPR